MTDTPATPANGGAPTPPAGPHLQVLAQFIRDLSFENPLAPDSMRANVAPQIDMGVEMAARTRPDGLYEVDLKITVTAARENKTVFQVELLYGGLFQLAGIPEDQLEPVLMIECPRFLFPFARRVIADATAEGGFPPLLLDPIDFANVYGHQRQQREALAQNAPAGNA